MKSASDFFRARPGLLDFALPLSMHYTLLINPKASELAATDPAAIEAIVAHELEHISSYANHSRWRMLGLCAAAEAVLSNTMGARGRRWRDHAWLSALG